MFLHKWSICCSHPHAKFTSDKKSVSISSLSVYRLPLLLNVAVGRQWTEEWCRVVEYSTLAQYLCVHRQANSTLLLQSSGVITVRYWWLQADFLTVLGTFWTVTIVLQSDEIMKTHRVTLSGTSATLSNLSCDTSHSYYSDSTCPDSEHNVSVSSLPAHGDHGHYSPSPDPDNRIVPAASDTPPYRWAMSGNVSSFHIIILSHFNQTYFEPENILESISMSRSPWRSDDESSWQENAPVVVMLTSKAISDFNWVLTFIPGTHQHVSRVSSYQETISNDPSI